MTSGIFITATGTDVGKTYVSALIVKGIRKQGINCGYYKPALSGDVYPNDCEYVFKTAGIKKDANNNVSYKFKPALSPHLASKLENNPIKLKKIKADFERIQKEFDMLVVEGAGGIICPFNDDLILPDVIKALGLDIIIIASAGLGTINSTVLTVEYAKTHKINIKGIILNNYDETDIMHVDNKKMIEKLTGIKVLTTVKTGDTEINTLPIEGGSKSMILGGVNENIS